MTHVVDQARAAELTTIWHQASEASARAQLAEREARRALIEYTFPDVAEGSDNKIDIGFGKVLQVTGVITRKLDMAVLEALKPTVDADVIDAIVRTKYDLSVSAWKALPNSIRLKLADAVTETPGAHQVKIVDKKK